MRCVLRAALGPSATSIGEATAQSSPSSSQSETTMVKAYATGPRLVVFSGSGLSASAGLATFSTPGGLYERAQKQHGLSSGSELFQYRFYERAPRKAQAFLAEVGALGLRACVHACARRLRLT